MSLVIHLACAFGSMAYATYAFFFPSRTGRWVTYGLIALTFASGFWLIFTTPVHMAEVCVTGLVYVAYISCAVVFSSKKLAKASQVI